MIKRKKRFRKQKAKAVVPTYSGPYIQMFGRAERKPLRDYQQSLIDSLSYETVTGRLNKFEPEMQKIGRGLRIVDENHCLKAVDYSWLEQRIAGWDLGRDAGKAYDIVQRYADARGIDRHRAKNELFGILYGQCDSTTIITKMCEELENGKQTSA